MNNDYAPLFPGSPYTALSLHTHNRLQGWGLNCLYFHLNKKNKTICTNAKEAITSWKTWLNNGWYPGIMPLHRNDLFKAKWKKLFTQVLVPYYNKHDTYSYKRMLKCFLSSSFPSFHCMSLDWKKYLFVLYGCSTFTRTTLCLQNQKYFNIKFRTQIYIF